MLGEIVLAMEKLCVYLSTLRTKSKKMINISLSAAGVDPTTHILLGNRVMRNLNCSGGPETEKGLHLCKPFVCMARWGGVEPPTFWFVARCSIQLSYQRFFIPLLYRPERLRIIPKASR